MLFICVWLGIGILASILVYKFDELKSDRMEVYGSNMYIAFMLVFWPIVIYVFAVVFFSNLRRRKND